MARSNGIRPPIDAPTISLPASFSVAENIGSAPITVTKSGNLSQISTVPYTVIPVTAGVADYISAASGVLVFAIGDSVKTIPNSIIDDFIVEPTETYLFILGADDATWVRGNNTCVVSIIDNDTFVSTQTIVSISSPTAAEGSNLVFTITLSGITQLSQTFAVTIGGTATPGADYATPIAYSNGVTFNSVNSTINIPIGVSSFLATTMTVTDSLIEGTETLIFSMGGITAIGNITDVLIGTLTAISRMTAFETPFGMLTTSQQTATATSGGYITACASRVDSNSDNYAVDISTTGPTGTYTRMLNNQQYSPYAEVNNVLSFQHVDVPFINEFDLPATLTGNTIGLMQDANGLQEFGLYSNYNSVTVAGATAKLFTSTTSAIFDSLPINVVDGNTAKIFLLNNRAQDTVFRASGTIVYLKFIPKLGAQEFTGAVTPIAVTIANRASKPLPPRNVLFSEGADFYSFPAFQFSRNPLTFQIDTASRTETPPSGFFNPSYSNEAGVTYEMDVNGADGFIRTKPFTLGATNTATYSLAERENIDRPYGITNYKFYAVKAGVRSLPYSFDLSQDIRTTAGPYIATAIQSGNNVLITLTIYTPNTSNMPYFIDFTLGGDVFTTQAYGTITCDNGVIVMSDKLLQVPNNTVTSFTMTVPTISAIGKTLTTTWGVDNILPTSTLITAPLTAVSSISALGGSPTETYSIYQNRFNVIFASACNAGAYPYSFSGTATFGGAFGTTPLAGADYTVEAMYFLNSVQTALTMTNSIVNLPVGVANFYLEIHPIIDGITETAETIICTVNGTTSTGNNTIAANAT